MYIIVDRQKLECYKICSGYMCAHTFISSHKIAVNCNQRWIFERRAVPALFRPLACLQLWRFLKIPHSRFAGPTVSLHQQAKIVCNSVYMSIKNWSTILKCNIVQLRTSCHIIDDNIEIGIILLMLKARVSFGATNAFAGTKKVYINIFGCCFLS